MSYAISLPIDRTYTAIPFPTTPEDRYKYVSKIVRSDMEGDQGLVEHVTLVINDHVFYIMVNEEGLLYRLPYNSMATMLYLDSLTKRHQLAYTPILVGQALLVGRAADGDWRGLNDDEVTGLLSYLDQLHAEIAGVRQAAIEGLS